MAKQKFLFTIPDGSRGHVGVTFYAKYAKVSSPNGAVKVEKGPKEDEGVARGHFHPRENESPHRCRHSGTKNISFTFRDIAL